MELSINGGLYAVFATPKTSHYDFVNTIHRTWNYINCIWLPCNGYSRTGGYEFETYTEESRSFSENIYIPIKEKPC
jgi:AraC family transcriptional regulator